MGRTTVVSSKLLPFHFLDIFQKSEQKSSADSVFMRPKRKNISKFFSTFKMIIFVIVHAA